MIAALTALERLLLPNTCVACERAVEAHAPDALVCGPCRTRLRPMSLGCPRCHQPLPPVGPCRFCAAWPPALERVQSAVWLGPEAQEMVHHLKYEGYAALGDTIADVMARHLRRPARGLLVPIPLSARRHRQRGYNQAGVIAAALASRWKLPVCSQALCRVRHTRSQTSLKPDERQRNVQGAFRAVGSVPPVGQGAREGRRADAPDPSAAPIILVDDILTTGATLAAAAAAFDAIGRRAVHAVTFARALPFALRAIA